MFEGQNGDEGTRARKTGDERTLKHLEESTTRCRCLTEVQHKKDEGPKKKLLLS